jgi:hypothetical protein
MGPLQHQRRAFLTGAPRRLVTGAVRLLALSAPGYRDHAGVCQEENAMRSRRNDEPVDDTVDHRDDRVYEEEEGTRATLAPVPFSPAQIIGLIIGIGYVVLGIVAVAKTGFHTDHIYTPQRIVWHLPHSPLLGVIEIGFGALLIFASVVPGGVRSLMALLGVVALVFGIVVVANAWQSDLHRWLAVTHRSGWVDIIAGSILILATMFAPVVFPERRRRVRHTERAAMTH